MSCLVYGANGYSGSLIARLAVTRGERPILAGRSAAPVRALAEELGLPYRVGPCNVAMLEDVGVLVNCAGPFAETARPAVAACLAAGAHYLDITGELDVFDWMFTQDAAARSAGVAMITGAGFDVVPTDCLAALLASSLPGAVSLELAFSAPGGLSRGTARTAVAEMGGGALRRVEGRLVPTRFGSPSREVPFPSGVLPVGATRWGDLVTAYHSTGIENITVYMPLPPGAFLAPIFRFGPLRRLARSLIRPGGPSADVRTSSGCEVWAEVRDAAGGSASATLTGPNAYALTADAAVTAAQRILAGNVSPGVHTPSSALGAEFVLSLDGVELKQLS
ncbi:saccharopine dehydrogenase family protein [Dactylosporangium matsuzakiense]|uniref:Saccharopine dehydrogenase n=1 Tax=Dactylosporangium matsuzakiense TaxID=53360 RepID=A0A9W6NPB1_9ACTN|nr:saccharopine dehydrogenase NADP-binding domain-containing protein [Dactylosporangium matsuzakiense]UWZ43550.1 saccharopine dehydrogenase NADP-binding domain-containing protein [Dactylosporangium matsuzakiense]GLL04123.1 saccharopine dehydrogenase [Dactylosporangium matsuzakiense]